MSCWSHKTLESNMSVVGSAEDPGDSGEVGCRGGATASCRFPIPHSVLLGSTASVHALQHSLALSSPTDTSASSTLPQATAAAAHVKFEAEEPLEKPPDRPCCAPRLHVFSPHMFQALLIMFAPCIRVQDGDRHVSCRPRPTPHGSLAERPTHHVTPSASYTLLAQTLVIILSS